MKENSREDAEDGEGGLSFMGQKSVGREGIGVFFELKLGRKVRMQCFRTICEKIESRCDRGLRDDG